MAKTTLRAKKTKEALYPQTWADIVQTPDGGNVEQKLQNITDTLSALNQNNDYKGYFPNETKLLEEYPNTITNPEERKGWYARVGAEGTGDTTMYYWDVEDNAWIKGATVNVSGVTTVNNIQPNEDGNLTLTSTNIPTTYTDEETGKTKSVQEVFNMLQSEHYDLESEIEKVDNKTSVLYLTNEEMEEAVSPSQLLSAYEDGQVVVCNDDGNYKLGSSYKYIAIETDEHPVNAWEEITASGTEITDTLTLTKEVEVPNLDGSVEYENLAPYQFYQLEDGYWKNNNTTNTYSYAMLKIKFNLNKSTNISFDFTQHSATQSGLSTNYAVFSKVDTTLSKEYIPGTGIYQSLMNLSSGVVTYENFPAGEHFITVKYVKSYNSEESYITFKLATDLQQEDGYTYTSTNSITVDNNNNLQIDNKNILVSGDSIPVLVGTDENPIILMNLNNGLYYLKGKFKWMEENKNVFSITDINSKPIDYQIKISVINNDVKSSAKTSTKSVTLFNCWYLGRVGGPFELSQTYWSVSQDAFVNLSSDIYSVYPSNSFAERTNANITISYNSYENRVYFLTEPIAAQLFPYTSIKTISASPSIQMGLSTSNTTAYTPTEDYHPATVKFVVDTVATSYPIKTFDNIEENIGDNTKNYLLTNNEIGENNELSYCKQYFLESVVKNYVKNDTTTVYESVSVNHDILNVTLPSELNGEQSIGFYQSYANASRYSGSTCGYIDFVVSNGKITTIKVTDNYGNKTYYLYRNSQWEHNSFTLNDIGKYDTNYSNITFLSIINDNMDIISHYVSSYFYSQESGYANIGIALTSKLGTQATFELVGTTLTITPK